MERFRVLAGMKIEIEDGGSAAHRRQDKTAKLYQEKKQHFFLDCLPVLTALIQFHLLSLGSCSLVNLFPINVWLSLKYMLCITYKETTSNKQQPSGFQKIFVDFNWCVASQIRRWISEDSKKILCSITCK